MGFLQWLADNQKEPDEQQQELDLGNIYNSNSQLLAKRERVDGAVVNRDFREAIHQKGGDGQCQVDSSVAMSQELFDMNPRQLYQQTGGKPYDRSTLPKEAQKAFIVGETVATHDLNTKEIKGVSQQEVNGEITDTVRGSAKKVRNLLPW